MIFRMTGKERTAKAMRGSDEDAKTIYAEFAVAAAVSVAIGAAMLFVVSVLFMIRIIARESRIKELEDNLQTKVFYSEPAHALDKAVDAIIHIESHGDPNAVSSSGARGLMQVMRPTWDEMTAKMYGQPLDFDKAFDPSTNRKVGTYYLNWIDGYLRGRLGDKYTFDGVIMAYNCGIGRYCKHVEQGTALPAETVNYIRKFRNAMGD